MSEFVEKPYTGAMFIPESWKEHEEVAIARFWSELLTTKSNPADRRADDKWLTRFATYQRNGCLSNARKTRRLAAYSIPSATKYIADLFRELPLPPSSTKKEPLTLDQVLQLPYRNDRRYQAMLFRLGMPF